MGNGRHHWRFTGGGDRDDGEGYENQEEEATQDEEISTKARALTQGWQKRKERRKVGEMVRLMYEVKIVLDVDRSRSVGNLNNERPHGIGPRPKLRSPLLDLQSATKVEQVQIGWVVKKVAKGGKCGGSCFFFFFFGFIHLFIDLIKEEI